MSISELDPSSADAVVDDESVGLRFDLREGHIGVLTLNRPERLNAINWDLYRALAAAFYRISLMDEVRVLLIQGAGRAFCAGGDVSFMRQMYEGEIDKQRAQKIALRYFQELVSLPQPTIAVVGGPAVGIGATTALSCDLVFASPRATFSDPHIKMGLVPGDGGALLWPMLIGPARAKRYLFTGDVVDADEAARLGLVTEVCPEAELEEHALQFARRLAEGPVEALRATKALTNHALRTLSEEAIRCSLTMELVSQDSQFHRQAAERFLKAHQPK